MADIALLAERLREIAASEHVKPEKLSRLVSDTFEHCGVPHEDAAIGAEVALWAQLHGSDLAWRRASAAVCARAAGPHDQGAARFHHDAGHVVPRCLRRR